MDTQTQILVGEAAEQAHRLITTYLTEGDERRAAARLLAEGFGFVVNDPDAEAELDAHSQKVDDDQRRSDEGDEQRDYAEERANARLMREQ